MNCPDCQELLSAYLDRELNADEQAEVARHLTSCLQCQRESSQLLSLKERLRAHPVPSMPSELIASIESKTMFRARWWEDLRLWWVPSLAAAAGLAAWMVLHGHKPVTPGAVLPVSVAQREPQDKALTLAQSPQVAWQPAADTETTKDLQ